MKSTGKQVNLFKHQQEALAKSKDHRAFGFLMDMGTGKSRTLLEELNNNPDITRVVIVAPDIVADQWLDEQLPEWLERPYTAVRYRSGSDFRISESPLQIVTLQYEATISKGGKELLRQFVDSNTLLCLDESTKIKSSKAVRTKWLTKVGKQAGWRRIMTGSPITRDLVDLYSQFTFLDKSILGVNKTQFLARYCIQEHIPGAHPAARRIIGYQNLEELHALIAPYCYIVSRDECLDLPGQTFVKREVPLTDKQREMYKQFEKELVIELGDGRWIESPNALTKILRLYQIVLGHFDIEHNRITVLEEVLDEIGTEQAIIAQRFVQDRENIARLCAAREERAYEYTLSDEIARHKQKLQQFCIINPQSAGFGVELSHCNITVFYSHFYDLELREQTEARTYRSGQQHHCLYIDLYAKGTVEEDILNSYKNKTSVIEEFEKRVKALQ